MFALAGRENMSTQVVHEMNSGWFDRMVFLSLCMLDLFFFFFLSFFFFKPRGNASISVTLVLPPKLSSGRGAKIRETRKGTAALPPSAPAIAF